MQRDFDDSIGCDVPPLFSAKTTLADSWPHELSGHCMCICGVAYSSAQYMVADPYVRFVSSAADSTYAQSASLIHSAIHARGNGYLYCYL